MAEWTLNWSRVSRLNRFAVALVVFACLAAMVVFVALAVQLIHGMRAEVIPI